MIEYYTDITNVTLWSLMVKPKKNSGARAELLALICFILEPEPSFLALDFLLELEPSCESLPS